MIKSVVWSSLLDYPGEVCTTLFLSKCSWKCAYCHNKQLTNQPSIDFNTEILPKLLKRKKQVHSIVISGGEPTENKKIFEIVKILKSNNFNVGLHTNGSNPNFLKKLLPYLSFIAMDIKGSKEVYTMDILPGVFKHRQYVNVIKSIDLIIKSNIKYEFRTTLYPLYIKEMELRSIAEDLKSRNVISYTLQQCKTSNQYSEEILKVLKYIANEYLPTETRGV